MTLGEMLGFNKDLITIWEKHPTDQKDEIGRPKIIFIKHIVKGRWEYKTKVIRKNGTDITSTAMLIVPFNPYGKELLYERLENQADFPGKEALKSLSYEEVSQLGGETVEWIIYI